MNFKMIVAAILFALFIPSTAWASYGPPTVSQHPPNEKVELTLEQKMYKAVTNNHADEVKKLLASEKMVNINERFLRNETFLMIAAQNGFVEIVTALLDAGAQINARSLPGLTALIKAAFYKQPKVVQILLNRGANVNAKGMHGSSALMISSYFGHMEVIKVLLASKVSIDQTSASGNSALMYAARAGNIEVVNLLIKHGADPNIINIENRRALEEAISRIKNSHTSDEIKEHL